MGYHCHHTSPALHWHHHHLLSHHHLSRVKAMPQPHHRRRAELNLADQRSLAGFGLGAGVKIKQARVGFAVSQLTKANFSYQLGLTLDINSLMK